VRRARSAAAKTGKRDNVHVCCNITGTDPVHLNVMFTPLVAESFGKLSEGALGCGVSRDGESALESQQGAKVDNLSTAERNHMSARFL
jgi:hypothetical protein